MCAPIENRLLAFQRQLVFHMPRKPASIRYRERTATSLRLLQSQNEVIVRAAKVAGTTRAQLIRTAALERAYEVLSMTTKF